MKNDKTKPNLEEKVGHLLPRSQRPAPLETPKPVGGLAAGDMLGKNPNETIVMCITCRKPLFVLYQIEEKSKFSTEQKPATPLGDWDAPKTPKDKCPVCRGAWTKLNKKATAFIYLTNKGIV